MYINNKEERNCKERVSDESDLFTIVLQWRQKNRVDIEMKQEIE